MQWLWDFLFPPFCGGCDWIGTHLCKKCLSEFVFLPPHLDMWWYTKSGCKVTAHSLVAYAQPTSTFVHMMKYGPVIALTDVVSELMWKHFPKPDERAVLITSVPSHPNKKRQRGFDQATLIAQKLAQWWKLPFVELLERKETQTSLVDQKSKQERIEAAESMFMLKKDEILKTLRSFQVVLIDDVMTTGSTVRVCAELLSQLGASNITIITFARKL
jgi:competence protein ComFC